MFFADRIKGIKEGDNVLEIGPGSSPHPRSNVFLELRYDSQEEEQAQFGYTGEFSTNKQIVYYDGHTFPFEDKSFDYVICSHVLEHVPDVPFFLSEIQRIASRGYLEYPNIVYDYAFNIPVHVNFLRKVNDEILWIKKADTHAPEFEKIQKAFYDLMVDQHFSALIHENKDLFFEGYEWENELNQRKLSSIDELIPTDYPIKPFNLEAYVLKTISAKNLVRLLVKKITGKFK